MVCLAQRFSVLLLFCEHKQQSSALDHTSTLIANALCYIQLKKTFFSLTLRPGIRLGSKYLSYALGSGLGISAVSSWVAMQFLKSVCLTAHSTHTQQLNGNRRPQWEITTFTGTYGPQPLSI